MPVFLKIKTTFPINKEDVSPLSAWVSFLFGFAEEGKHIGSDFSISFVFKKGSLHRKNGSFFSSFAPQSDMWRCVSAWEKGKRLLDPSYPPLHLLTFFSSPLAPSTLTYILPTVWDLTAQKPPISPTHGVIWHRRCVAGVFFTTHVCVCRTVFSTDRMCVRFKHLSSVAPKVLGVFGLRSGS